MWAEKTPNGKIKFRERYQDPLTGASIKVSVIMEKDTASTRKTAQAILNEKIDKKSKEYLTVTAKKDLTLSELIHLYRISQETSVRDSTYQRNYSVGNTIIKLLGGDSLVNRLTAGYVKKKFSSNNAKPSTVNERITRFKALMRWAYQNDLAADISWLEKLTPLKDEEKKKKLEEKYLESEELKRLLSAMTEEKWRLLTEFCALSGLRIGEALALKTTDIDYNKRYINVLSTYNLNTHKTGVTKTYSSTRQVYIQNELFSLCKNINLYMNKQKLAYGYNTDLFFSDTTGQHLSYGAYRKYLGIYSKRVVGKSITPHYMRHTHVALMAEHDVPLEIISRRLGHADSEITRDIYFHVTQKKKEADNQKIKEIHLL